ncbi:unnamed protein product [Aureobasidium mustum]|uniref:Uncharacterized protein n=1 Tax=Aureobasidium mustum TaxID=2773714 RepID=A0A9N8JMF6_9PEZI|nr:unnamed protein product [Aureobasidium mustum]
MTSSEGSNCHKPSYHQRKAARGKSSPAVLQQSSRPCHQRSRDRQQRPADDYPAEDHEAEEDTSVDHICKMIDETLEALEGKQDVGVFCVCNSTCECKETCATATKDKACLCKCYERMWPMVRREQPQNVGNQPQARVQEERPITPRSVSVYSQSSIQASPQAQEQQEIRTPDNNHASLSTHGTWSASRAELWARLSAPGPPTPTASAKPKAGRG